MEQKEDLMRGEESSEQRTKRLYREMRDKSCVERYRGATISKQTSAALMAKARVQDALNALVMTHEMLYSECEDEAYNKIIDAMEPAEKLADKYLLESITDNLASLDSTEI